MNVTDNSLEYAKSVKEKAEKAGLRVELDSRNEKIGYKIRQAQLEKVPYMFIIGDKEAESGTVSVRHRKDGDTGSVSVDEAIAKLVYENATKKID